MDVRRGLCLRPHGSVWLAALLRDPTDAEVAASARLPHSHAHTAQTSDGKSLQTQKLLAFQLFFFDLSIINLFSSNIIGSLCFCVFFKFKYVYD